MQDTDIVDGRVQSGLLLRKDVETGSYWAILGGLIGRETRPDGRMRMRFRRVF